jgi:polysaccharide export outer membrane protein
MRKFCTVLLVVFALSACARREPLVSTDRLTVVQDTAALPAPTRQDLTAPDRPALIGPLDTIQVDVFNIPDLSREMQVDASGGIAMPSLGASNGQGCRSGGGGDWGGAGTL